jgi:uncharacterized protein
MGKFTFWLVLAGVVWLGWALWRSHQKRQDAAQARHQSQARAAQAPNPGVAPEPMVRCAHCHLYLPAREALADRAHHFCSAAHREAGPRPEDSA